MNAYRAGAADERVSVQLVLDSKQCVRTRSRFSTCSRCATACAFQALSLNGVPNLDEAKCTGCGACLHACPTGALTGNHNVGGLVQCIAQQFFKRVELACPSHPAPQIGPKNVDAVVRVETCLAALGPSDYLLLLAEGVSQLVVRVDECGPCPVGRVQSQILDTVAVTVALLDAWGQGERLSVLRTHEKGGQVRPLFEAGHPTISRRELFRLFKPGRDGAAASTPALHEAAAGRGKRIPPERRRLLGALKKVVPAEVPARIQPLPESLCLTALTADENCNACGVCTRICPTGALAVDDTRDGYSRLVFRLTACTDCGLCFDVCAPHALHRAPASASDLLGQDPLVLREGASQSCKQCGARFVASGAEELCFVCSAKRSRGGG